MAFAESLSPQKEPPHNIEAEQEVLGAVLVDNDLAQDFRAFLTAEDFYHPAHGRIWDAAIREIDRGGLADPVTLRGAADLVEGLEAVGGGQYLGQLVDALSSRRTAPAYARTVHALAVRRRLIAWGEDIASAAATELDGDAADLISEAERALAEIAATGAELPVYDFDAVIASTLETISARMSGETPGALPTGLTDFDRQTGGLHLCDLHVIAGRPSMGKSALSGTIAFNVARAGHGVLFNSLEMARDQLGVRLLSMDSRVTYSDAWQGRIGREDYQRMYAAGERLRSLPIHIADRGRMSMADVRQALRTAKRRNPIKLVIVDYIQIAQMDDRYRGNRVAEISEITAALKALAKNEGVAVVALSQLSRESEKRPDPTPILSDLRESGSIEQDADAVTFVHRPEVYLQRKVDNADPEQASKYAAALARSRNIAELIVAKQRMGPLGKVETYFDGRTSRFADLSARGE
ncbi:replicative DNA helicase [Marinibaculum pumilum]|uniref:Replicative DNA helicase n=1 Tax=Marinibaculum pumilum TaxID=1766165 RepID=A0ABV7L349_9PROT